MLLNCGTEFRKNYTNKYRKLYNIYVPKSHLNMQNHEIKIINTYRENVVGHNTQILN